MKNASDLDTRYTTLHMIIVSTNPFVDKRFYLKIFMDAVSLPKDVNVVMCINCLYDCKEYINSCLFCVARTVKIIRPVIINTIILPLLF